MAAIFLTRLRRPHLHERCAYYIAPTCWLPRGLSSSVAGNNGKLLLPVIWHHATVEGFFSLFMCTGPLSSGPGGIQCACDDFSFIRQGVQSPHRCRVNQKPRREASLQIKDSLPLNLRLNLGYARKIAWPCR